MRRIFVLLLLAAPTPAMAQLSTSNATNNESSSIAAPQNQQQNTSSSTSVGGNNYSNVYMTEFGKTSVFEFSQKGVRCESPRFSVGIWADPGNQYYERGFRTQDEHDIRGGVSLAIPLGAERKTCQEMARTFEKRVKFDTAKGIAKSCTALTQAGTEWTRELLDALPELKVCAKVAGLFKIDPVSQTESKAGS